MTTEQPAGGSSGLPEWFSVGRTATSDAPVDAVQQRPDELVAARACPGIAAESHEVGGLVDAADGKTHRTLVERVGRSFGEGLDGRSRHDQTGRTSDGDKRTGVDSGTGCLRNHRRSTNDNPDDVVGTNL